MVSVMEDQNEAWQRLTDARLQVLERAVKPGRIRRSRSGRPLSPLPYEPGDRKPLPQWLEIRLFGVEMLLRILLDVDSSRAEDLDVDPYAVLLDAELDKLDTWSRSQIEPDILIRQTMAIIEEARIILMETHTWPLLDIEDVGE